MLWVAVLAAIGIGAMTAPGTSSGALSVPGTQSQRAIDLLRKEFPQASADGATADVATRLAMRESTVKAHVSRILTALEVTNRFQAALVARDAGLTT
ncbi:LuxR C-terminal-related transcriptional regulator [Streptomyces canus]|uniref:LuxR C-terminal-related transcriptional regulator n=1 Tax=Streptomyces canus TaxID=58343 RepID=UPI00340AE56B